MNKTHLISCIYPKKITSQRIVEGNLVTTFEADELCKHPAGTLVCKPCTRADIDKWNAENNAHGELDEFGGILSDTVTRFGVLFWDIGELTPCV
jgi:hypothetical protein